MSQNNDIVTALQNNGKILSQIQQALAAITTAIAVAFPPPKNSSASWVPGTVTTGAQATKTVTVSGAALGDYASASLGEDLQGAIMTAYVSAANTVTVVLFNNTGGTLTFAATTVSVRTYSH